MATDGKYEGFQVYSSRPLCGGPRPSDLGHTTLTPTERFFVRNHGATPRLAADDFRLELDGMVRRPLRLRLSDLRVNFVEVELTLTLLGAGHRRAELARLREIPGEVPWQAEAVGTATWRGTALAEVLEAGGLLDGARHVHLLGLDRVKRGGGQVPFASSIPLEKARDSDVLLAWEMNGEPLPPEHGFPLRLVVPGYVGACSVKWLSRLDVRLEPSDSPFRTDYRHVPLGGDSGFPLGELPVTSAICAPADGGELVAGDVAVAGWALAGGHRSVERVEVTADHGRSWQAAELEEAPVGAWRLWSARLPLEPGAHELACRAWDSSAHTQPEDPAHLWNTRGYLNNAWHRVRVWVA